MKMKKIFLALWLLSSTLCASILESDFLVIERDNISIKDESKFFSYIKSLDNQKLLQEYKQIFAPVDLLPSEQPIEIGSYDKVFEELREIYAKLYFKESPQNIDMQIQKIVSRQKNILTLILDASEHRSYDADTVPVLLEYFKLDRNALFLQTQKQHLELKRQMLIDLATKKKLSFEDELFFEPQKLSHMQEQKNKLSEKLKTLRTGSQKERQTATELAELEYRYLTLEIYSDFAKKIRLLKLLKTSPTAEATDALRKLLSKRYEPSKRALEISEPEVTEKKELFFARKAVNDQDNDVFRAIYQGIGTTAAAKTEFAFESLKRKAALWMESPLFIAKGLDLRPKNILLVITAIAFILLAKRILITKGLGYYFARRKEPASQDEHLKFVLGKIVSFTAYLLIAITVLGGLGIDLTNFAILISALSVGIGFGLQGVVSNFVSGLILLFENTVKIGDVLILPNGQTGTVVSVNLRTTTIRTYDDVTILIPNATMFTGEIENLTKDSPLIRRRVHFTVALGSDLVALQDALSEKALQIGGKSEPKPPHLAVLGISNSGLDCEFRVYVDIKDNALESGDFLESFLEVFERLNIELPWPKLQLVK